MKLMRKSESSSEKNMAKVFKDKNAKKLLCSYRNETKAKSQKEGRNCHKILSLSSHI